MEQAYRRGVLRGVRGFDGEMKKRLDFMLDPERNSSIITMHSKKYECSRTICSPLWKACRKDFLFIPSTYPARTSFAGYCLTHLLLAGSSTGRAYPAREVFRFMPSSKLQRKLTAILEQRFPSLHLIPNHSASWLLTEFNRRLQLDVYLPSLNMAIEVQGEQHLEYIPYFHKSPEGFYEQLERDRKKRELCSRNNVLLLEIFYDSQIPEIINLISARQNLTHCLSYTPEQWTQLRKDHRIKRSRPFRVALYKVNKQINRLRFSDRKLEQETQSELADLVEIRKLLVKKKDNADHDAVIEFAATYADYYKIQTSDASYDQRIRENGIRTINRALEYERTFKYRLKGDSELTSLTRSLIIKDRQLVILKSCDIKDVKVETKEQDLADILSCWHFIVRLAKASGHPYQVSPPKNSVIRIKKSAKKMLKPMGITWAEMIEIRLLANDPKHYLYASPESIPGTLNDLEDPKS